MSKTFRLVAICVVFGAVGVFGDVQTRAEEIEEARAEKARQLQPDELPGIERALNQVKDKRLLERLTAGIAGIRVRFGGLITGSGFALGPEYVRRDLAAGNVTLRTSVRASLKRYQIYEVELGFPRLADGKAFGALRAVHRNYPGVNYYGQGPDSSKNGRSAYRLEDTDYGFEAGVIPVRHLRLGTTGGYLQANVGPGDDSRYVSSDLIYAPSDTPGIDRQSDFLHGGGFAQFDFRDNPGGPRKGGNYLARFTYYSDRGLNLHTFRRLDLEAQQYFSFLNARRVIALRAKSVVTYSNPGQRVPFYLQPTLGGPDTLRGFRAFRFYDDNMIAMNGEYRWETFSGLDAALFVDGGKVFHRRAQWNFKDLEGSYGFGLRFNVRNDVFLRIDVGFSHEGYQLWLKFDNVF